MRSITDHRHPPYIQKTVEGCLGFFQDHEATLEEFSVGGKSLRKLCMLQEQLGGIVGLVEVVDCVRDHFSPWARPDCWHWVLDKPRLLPMHPCKGSLGLFRVEYPHELAAIPTGSFCACQ